MDLNQYYQRQVSFTEWFEQIKHAQTAQMREEDNEKRERLTVIHDITGLPYDTPVQFDAEDIANTSPAFLEYLAGHANDLCALRLIPRDASLPKLRIRGKSVRESCVWFHEQGIDPKNYRADIVPHSESAVWSTCFVVHEKGIIGEIIADQHTHLTQGYYSEGQQPIAFHFDWREWRMREEDEGALDHLKVVAGYVHITDPARQNILTQSLGAQFSRDHLQGYFETVATKEFGTWFIDYNRILGGMYQNFVPVFPHTREVSSATLVGMSAHGGVAQGIVRVVEEKNISTAVFEKGDILVCDMTSPLYIPLMQKAAAIVTDRGGILSHAAIVSRELGKPCITGTKRATKVLKDGDRAEVDADRGVIVKLG